MLQLTRDNNAEVIVIQEVLLLKARIDGIRRIDMWPPTSSNPKNGCHSSPNPPSFIKTMAMLTMTPLCWLIFSLSTILSSGVEVKVNNVDSSINILDDGRFSVQALIDAVAVPEALDLNSAIEMVSSPWALPDDPKLLYEATVQTNQHAKVPLLHHLFNLFQRFEQHPQARFVL